VQPRITDPGRLLIVLGLNPAHYAKAPDVVEVDGLEAEEAEVRVRSKLGNFR
jgi:hypothetical protein